MNSSLLVFIFWYDSIHEKIHSKFKKKASKGDKRRKIKTIQINAEKYTQDSTDHQFRKHLLITTNSDDLKTRKP